MSATEREISLRQPYPGGSDRHIPIVPHVLIIGERRSHYLPPSLIRAVTIYDTPTTVRLQMPATAKGGARQETQVQHKVWAVPDDTAWSEIEAACAAFGGRLEDLANLLRRLGSYPTRLAAWKGKTAPNPICSSVARIDDPDKPGSGWWLSAWWVPRLERKEITRHTAKMLSSGDIGSYVFSQEGCFVLADDADWAEVESAHQAAEGAAKAMEHLLARLGTYQDALDGRHTQPAPAPHFDQTEALAVIEPPIAGDIVEASPAGALSARMQDIARHYVAARRKTGEGLLESASWMAEARAAAAHGEWGLFLAATGTSEGTAKRLIDIHSEAERNPTYRQQVLDGWLRASVAALIAQSESPTTLLERLLLEESAPSVADVRAAEAARKSAKLADLPPARPAQRSASSSGGGGGGARAQAPDPETESTHTALIARAAAAGYTLTLDAAGAGRLVEAATGTPWGGVKDLADAEARVTTLERHAGQMAQGEQLVTSVGLGTAAERAYQQLEAEIAGDLERLGPDGARRWAVLLGDDPDGDGESLWRALTCVARERPDLVAVLRRLP